MVDTPASSEICNYALAPMTDLSTRDIKHFALPTQTLIKKSALLVAASLDPLYKLKP